MSYVEQLGCHLYLCHTSGYCLHLSSNVLHRIDNLYLLSSGKFLQEASVPKG